VSYISIPLLASVRESIRIVVILLQNSEKLACCDSIKMYPQTTHSFKVCKEHLVTCFNAVGWASSLSKHMLQLFLKAVFWRSGPTWR